MVSSKFEMEQYKLVRYFIDVYFRVCLDISSNSSCQRKGEYLEQAKIEISFNQSRECTRVAIHESTSFRYESVLTRERGSMRDVNIQSIDKLGRTVANTAGSYG